MQVASSLSGYFILCCLAVDNACGTVSTCQHFRPRSHLVDHVELNWIVLCSEYVPSMEYYAFAPTACMPLHVFIFQIIFPCIIYCRNYLL